MFNRNWMRLGLATAALSSIVMMAPAASGETVLRVIPHADLKNLDPIWTTA